jgi:uncharacterized protein
MKKLIFLFAIFISFNASAQTQQKVNSIKVIGTAEMEIVPDEIYMSITINEYMKDKKKVMIEDLEKNFVNYMETVVKAEKQNITMENLDARMIALKRKQNKDELIRKNYEVKLKNFDQVMDVLVAMDSLKMYAYVSRLSHSKMDEYKKQIKINAIKAARDKADYLMAAIGQKAGKAISVVETDGYVGVEDRLSAYGGRAFRGNTFAQSNSYMEERDMRMEDGGVSGLGSRTIKIRYQIEAEFAIE